MTTPTPTGVALRLGLQVLIRISGLVSGLISTAVLARGLGHDDFGRFATCLSILALASVASELGLNSAAVREMSVRADDRDSIARALLVARSATSVVATVIAVAAAAVTFGSSNLWWPGVPILCTLLLAPLTTGQAQAQSEFRLGAQNALLFLQSWLWPVGVVLLTTAGGDSLAYAGAFFASALVCAVVAALIFRWPARAPAPQTRGEVVRLLSLAAPYALSGIFVTVYYRVGGLVLFAVAGASVAADYSASFRLIDALQTLPAALLTVVLPLISRAFRPDRGPTDPTPQQVFDLGVRSVLLMSLPIAVGGALVSQRIVGILYGGEYDAASRLLPVLLFAYPAICLGYVLTTTVVASGRTTELAPITGTIAAFNVVACLVFVPMGGALAAAWVTVATEIALVGALGVLISAHHRLRPPWGQIARIGVATTALALALAPVRDHPLWTTLPIGVVVFCTAVWAVKAVDSRDLRLLRSRHADTPTGTR